MNGAMLTHGPDQRHRCTRAASPNVAPTALRSALETSRMTRRLRPQGDDETVIAEMAQGRFWWGTGEAVRDFFLAVLL